MVLHYCIFASHYLCTASSKLYECALVDCTLQHERLCLVLPHCSGQFESVVIHKFTSLPNSTFLFFSSLLFLLLISFLSLSIYLSLATVLTVVPLPPSLFTFNSYSVNWTCNDNPLAQSFDLLLINSTSLSVVSTLFSSQPRVCSSTLVNSETWNLTSIPNFWLNQSFKLRLQLTGLSDIHVNSNVFSVQGAVPLSVYVCRVPFLSFPLFLSVSINYSALSS